MIKYIAFSLLFFVGCTTVDRQEIARQVISKYEYRLPDVVIGGKLPDIPDQFIWYDEGENGICLKYTPLNQTPVNMSIVERGKKYPNLYVEDGRYKLRLRFDEKEGLYRHHGEFGPFVFFEYGARQDKTLYINILPIQRTVDCGSLIITQEYDAETRTWTDISWIRR